ncbi:MAG TPA: Rieske (2Fe-2S) protein [Longimicrobiales bacterium]|nr:Rieske (2Fe-2S) protein [Longimicrobiales bacterium]
MTGDPPQADHGRRRFLSRISLTIAGIAALLSSIPFIGFIFRPAAEGDEGWRDVGPLVDFPVGTTRKVTYPDPDPDPWGGLTVRNAAWVRREREDAFTAFSVYCTHTGCPVAWEEDAGLFLCPCHGGVFDRDGDVAAGPPPRPLDRASVRVRNGRVEVSTVIVPTHD